MPVNDLPGAEGEEHFHSEHAQDSEGNPERCQNPRLYLIGELWKN